MVIEPASKERIEEGEQFIERLLKDSTKQR